MPRGQSVLSPAAGPASRSPGDLTLPVPCFSLATSSSFQPIHSLAATSPTLPPALPPSNQLLFAAPSAPSQQLALFCSPLAPAPTTPSLQPLPPPTSQQLSIFARGPPASNPNPPSRSTCSPSLSKLHPTLFCRLQLILFSEINVHRLQCRSFGTRLGARGHPPPFGG